MSNKFLNIKASIRIYDLSGTLQLLLKSLKIYFKSTQNKTSDMNLHREPEILEIRCAD